MIPVKASPPARRYFRPMGLCAEALRVHSDRDILAALRGCAQGDRYWAGRGALSAEDLAIKAIGEESKAALLQEARRRGLVGERDAPSALGFGR